jgi:hypothetical protein
VCVCTHQVGGDDYWAAFKDALKADGVYVTTVGKERRSKHTDALDSMSALQYRADYFLRQAFNSIGAAKNYHILTGSQILSSDLRIVASLLEKGTIRPIVDSVYSLYDIAKVSLPNLSTSPPLSPLSPLSPLPLPPSLRSTALYIRSRQAKAMLSPVRLAYECRIL